MGFRSCEGVKSTLGSLGTPFDGIVYGVGKRLAEYGKLRKRLEEIEKDILNRKT